MAIMQGYMGMLARYASQSEQLGLEFYEWALDTYGVPDEGENVNFDTYAHEFLALVVR